MLKRKTTTAITLVFLIITALAFSQSEKEAQELLKKISETYKSLKSYHFEGTMVVEMKAEGFQNMFEVPLMMAAIRPDKIRIETKSPSIGSKTVVSNGQTTWTYLPELKQYTKKAFVPVEVDTGESAGRGGLGLVSKYQRMEEQTKWAKILREEVVEFEGKSVRCCVMETEHKPRAGDTDIEWLPRTLWIDTARYLVLRESSTGRMKSSLI